MGVGVRTTQPDTQTLRFGIRALKDAGAAVGLPAACRPNLGRALASWPHVALGEHRHLPCRLVDGGHRGRRAGPLAGCAAGLPGRQAAQADAARAQAELARDQAEETRLDRRRTLLGSSPHGVETYTVALVPGGAEMERAARKLTGDGPTGYVVLQVNEGSGDVNRALSLRMLIEQQHYLCRPPTVPEREVEKGLEALGVKPSQPGLLRLSASPGSGVRHGLRWNRQLWPRRTDRTLHAH
jgi:hypothetical protein